VKKEDYQFINAREVAEILHISYRHFLKLLKEGEISIPRHKIGKRERFVRKDVENYLEKSVSQSYTSEHQENSKDEA
jgi:excisionase family DNA binding protein